MVFQESYPKLSAEVAGDRKYDVYMGIDVFGRGSFGGGQWTVCLGNSCENQPIIFHIVSLIYIYIYARLILLMIC